jgi:hypothetical protein
MLYSTSASRMSIIYFLFEIIVWKTNGTSSEQANETKNSAQQRVQTKLFGKMHDKRLRDK